MQVTRPQPSSPDAQGLTAVREQLGLPRIGTARPFALAMIIDAVGSGLFPSHCCTSIKQVASA